MEKVKNHSFNYCLHLFWQKDTPELARYIGKKRGKNITDRIGFQSTISKQSHLIITFWACFHHRSLWYYQNPNSTRKEQIELQTNEHKENLSDSNFFFYCNHSSTITEWQIRPQLLVPHQFINRCSKQPVYVDSENK